MSPLVSWLALVALSGLALAIVFRIDANLWKRKYDRDRVADDLAELRRLEQWRAVLGRQYVKTNTERENRNDRNR